MGHKVHPIGFRLGGIRTWDAKWFANRNYTVLVQEDLRLRRAITKRFSGAGISTIEIDRNANQVMVTIHTARPGVVIGRGGQRVDAVRAELERQVGKRVRINIQEIRLPELDARLVARSVADVLEGRVAYRRAMRQAITRTMQRGAQGIRITCAGRLGGAEIARRETDREGRVPLHTLRADIDYGMAEARTTYGRVGVKVWIYRGDVLPAARARATEPLAGSTLPAGPSA